MKRLLITGATGFIGTHCLRLVVNGDYDEIHAVSRSGAGPNERGVVWHGADLLISSQTNRLIERVRPTHLFHAAWIATPGVYLSSPENIDWMLASIALVRAFAKQGGRRFVAIGSSAEYGSSDEPCKEDLTPLQPASIYGKSKVATWHAIQAIAQYEKLQAAWGRLFLPYGPGDPPERLIPTAIASLRARRPLSLSHGAQQRDFIYAPDAAKQLVRLLDAETTGAFNIGSGIARSVRSVLESIADRFDAHSSLRFGEMPLREGEPAVLVASMNKFTEQLGRFESTLMTDAIDELVARLNLDSPDDRGAKL